MSYDHSPGASALTRNPVLSIRNLTVELRTSEGIIRPVDEVSYDLFPAETLGVVGESGSGKSLTVLAAMGLIPPRVVHSITGEVLLNGRDLLQMSPRELQGVRGKDISMVFQNPSAALNPVMRIGQQIAEGILLHEKVSRRALDARVVDLLALVGVPQPELRAAQYPHQFSGGMAQRAVIAMAIANRPQVLIADEPTTAVDVSVQSQLLEVLQIAQEETGASTVMISHDLGVVSQMAERICVMYAGRIVESGRTEDVFRDPTHPYSAGLLRCIPRLSGPTVELQPIPGSPPDPHQRPEGCAFSLRCEVRKGRDMCVEVDPALRPSGVGRASACHFPEEVSA